MKKNARQLICLLGLCMALLGGLQAKPVKFIVDMSGITKNVTGIHLTGDFQTLAGYAGGDWNSATISMVQSPSDTNIYSVTVNIPAMAKYEYKFVNGDQFYEVEFVPLMSRVGYNFNDNRWIYIDSLANDTTVVGPLRFSGNAAMGYKAARFVVNMENEAAVSPLGVHVAGDFQGWDPAATKMYSFIADVYEYIGFVDSTVGQTGFGYYNGNTLADKEVILDSCAVSGNRRIALPQDSLLPTVCFAHCSDCIVASVNSSWQPRISVYPNPATEQAMVRLDNHFGEWSLRLLDVQGRIAYTTEGAGEQAVTIRRDGLAAGLYFVHVTNAAGEKSVQKLIFR